MIAITKPGQIGIGESMDLRRKADAFPSEDEDYCNFTYYDYEAEYFEPHRTDHRDNDPLVVEIVNSMRAFFASENIFPESCPRLILVALWDYFRERIPSGSSMNKPFLLESAEPSGADSMDSSTSEALMLFPLTPDQN